MLLDQLRLYSVAKQTDVEIHLVHAGLFNYIWFGLEEGIIDK